MKRYNENAVVVQATASKTFLLDMYRNTMALATPLNIGVRRIFSIFSSSFEQDCSH